MKVSINWIRQFTDIQLSEDELLHKIGAQIGEVESVEHIGETYASTYIVRVVSCEKHPNADSLWVCLLDDGGAVSDVERTDGGYVQVVCGAQNVRADMLAVWLPPGATVPNSVGADPFVLDARDIRGHSSNGMLASSKELSIGDDHSGIVEVDIPVAPGTPFKDAYELDDIIVEIENKMFTHRPDCFGILGVAREIAGVQSIPFTSPDWYMQEPEFSYPSTKTEFDIYNQVSDRVHRFSGVVVDNVSVKPSPLSMQTYLARVGIRPINSIVDATNYVMVLTGQPLHAYDAHKLVKVSGEQPLQLGARLARAGDELDLLDGTHISFEDGDETVLITSHDVPVGIGGVMGGAATEVDQATTRVVLEAATFDMYGIRRTSMKHGLFTDAVTRFNKGQSSLQTTRALQEAMLLLERDSGGSQTSELVDVFPNKQLAHKDNIAITPEFVSRRLGFQIHGDEMKAMLENVEFSVHATAEDYHITPPFWRQDIQIPEDIVEEVLRLKGYDSLVVSLPYRSLAPVKKDDDIEQAHIIRRMLSASGANEVLTYSFVHKKTLERAQQNSEVAFALTNAISPDLHYYRLSVTPSLLEKVHANHKAGYKEFSIFELSSVHQKAVMDQAEPEVPYESPRLAFVYSSDDLHWDKYYAGAAYYQAGLYLNTLLDELSVPHTLVSFKEQEERTDLTPMQQQMIAPFAEDRSALVLIDDVVAGVMGELKASVRQSLKLPLHCAAFELEVAQLRLSENNPTYRPLSKYPSIQQDISLKMSASVRFKEIYASIIRALTPIEDLYFEVQPIDIFVPDKDVSSKHFAFRITAWSKHKTLRSEDLSSILDDVASAAGDEFDAVRL